MPGRGTDSLSAISNTLGNILLLSCDFSDGTNQGFGLYNGAVYVINENQALKVKANHNYQGCTHGFPLVTGKQYNVQFDIDNIDAGGLDISVTSGGWRQVQYATGSSGHQNFTFTAAGNSGYILIETNGSHGPGDYDFILDNFMMTEVKPTPEVPPVVSDGCITMTQSKWVTVWEHICKDPPTWPNTTPIGNGTAVNNGTAIQITIPTAVDGVSYTQEVVPDVWQTLQLTVKNVISGTGYIYVLEEQNGVLQSIGMQSFSNKGDITVNFKPKTSYITWQVQGPVQTEVTQLCFDRPILKQENVLVTICPEDKDKYRFGFNGQEKVNEWAGMGNYMDYGERGYDSRVGRWLARDPLSGKYPAVSPYVFTLNNPIKYKDANGRDVDVAINDKAITFSSTIYVTGPNAADVAADANEEFVRFSQTSLQNLTYKDEAEGIVYTVKISMNFVAVDPNNPNDPNYEGYTKLMNSGAGVNGDNMLIITSDKSKLYNGTRAQANQSASSNYGSHIVDFIAGNGRKQAKNLKGVGNMAYLATKDCGLTAIHETLHNFGLGDRYIENVNYRTATNSDGGFSTKTQGFYSGFQFDIMACGGYSFNQEHVNNLVKNALSINKATGKSHFVMAQKVDAANNSDKQNAVETFKIGTDEYIREHDYDSKKGK